MEKKNIPIEKKIFRDIYVFYEKYAGREQTDSYWKEVVKEMEKMIDFYKQNTLCKDFLVAVVCYLENLQ